VKFERELPKTRVGKIDYRVLVQEHVAKHGTKEGA
jgi:acyl-coenzyme A synthetase/AMP-(fatty) acid ligase